MLVTESGGAKVVICAGGNKLLTRDPTTGTLVPINPDGAVGRLLQAAPRLLNGNAAIYELARQLRKAHRNANGAEVETLIDKMIDLCIVNKVAAEPLNAEAPRG